MKNGLKEKFLDPSGWTRSSDEGRPVAADGRALPWFTYGAIELLHQVVRPEDRVFEFGAGASTLWWQERVRRLYSIDHDLDWVDRLKPQLANDTKLRHIAIDTPVPPEVRDSVADFFQRPRRRTWPYDEARIIRRGLEDDRFVAYATAIATLTEADELFDFIVIDGMARRLCAWTAVDRLQPDGFIILDNSNRADYDLAYVRLAEMGFRQIPCWGLVPGADFMTNTSFFTRRMDRLPTAHFSDNSLGLRQY